MNFIILEKIIIHKKINCRLKFFKKITTKNVNLQICKINLI